MADASVSIGGDASGAIAACAAAQGAIDALHGKTVNIDINTRGGGAGGMGEATRGMEKFGQAADRAGRSARGMGDDLGRSSGHMGRMANDAEKLRNHLAAVDNVLRNGPAGGGSSRSSGGMRALANDADRARQSIGELSSGSRGMRAIESGSAGAGRGMKELTQGADGAYRSMARLGGSSGEVEKFAGALRTIDAVGRTIGGGGSGGGGGRGFGGMFDGLGGVLGDVSQGAAKASGALTGMGMAIGYSAIGMGALGAAVAGVGLAGVAEDVMHNSQLMHA